MRRSLQLFCIALFSVLFSTFLHSQSKNLSFTDLSGPYLGQKPPGKVPVLFAPGIISKPGFFAGCSGFMNDGTVFVYSSTKNGSDWRFKAIYVTELKDGHWTEPEIAPFSDLSPYNFTVGPSGQMLYFTSLRPYDNTRMLLEQSNIWAVKREGNVWSKAFMLGASINTEQYYENYPAVASNGTVYYMSRHDDGLGKTDIYRSKNIDGKYSIAENLGTIINTAESDQDPFVAPDESYLIYCQRKPDGYGEYDLYISYKKSNDTWTAPINMGSEINSPAYEFRPYVTPDGKYFFFTSNRSDDIPGSIYWVDAQIIEDLKPDYLK